ncbi:hypothetical protein BHE74_00038219 [Ensete ventricosum]|nr:hypothetical protein BHE74_00038219 [Ensete ventricosum]
MSVLVAASSLLLVVMAMGAARGSSRREADRVGALPGQPAVEFRHYAGYVSVSDDKALFYWFFEAKRRPEEKPLVLWLNGDLEELGDRTTAQDSHTFLLNWFKRFPDFKYHDLYIAGESYAGRMTLFFWLELSLFCAASVNSKMTFYNLVGHYVPQLAELIYEGNKNASKDSFINLRGFMIGNAVLNDATDQLGMVEYAWSHAIISDELYSTVRKECNSFKEEGEGGRASKLCSPAVRAFLQAYNDIDIYSIYSPICLSSLTKSSPSRKLVAAPKFFSRHEIWHYMRKMPTGYDPCTEDDVEKYFNKEDVQRALHANVTRLSYPYSPCRF